MISRKKNGEPKLCSGCGAVGSEVASNIRDPWFESSHLQYLKLYKCIEKTKIKRGREWPLKSEKKFEKMSFDW